VQTTTLQTPSLTKNGRCVGSQAQAGGSFAVTRILLTKTLLIDNPPDQNPLVCVACRSL
jgi:hypothetical protein